MNRDPARLHADAGEFVLGTLTPAEQAAFEHELARDPELLAEVYAWQDRLLGLSRMARPIDPPSALWDRIETRLQAAPAAAARPAKRLPRPRGSAANDPFWRRVPVLQGLNALALALVLVLSALLALRGEPPSPAPPARYLAVLQAPDSKTAGWIVEVTAGDRVRLVPMLPNAGPPPGKTLQFWTKPPGAAGPTSLGLLTTGGALEIPASRLPALGDQQLFELTLEPETGSPYGRPSGPVMFIGNAVRL